MATLSRGWPQLLLNPSSLFPNGTLKPRGVFLSKKILTGMGALSYTSLVPQSPLLKKGGRSLNPISSVPYFKELKPAFG